MVKRLRQDLDVSASAAFENAIGEMAEARNRGHHVHKNLALGAAWLRNPLRQRSGRGLNIGHRDPLVSGGSHNALCTDGGPVWSNDRPKSTRYMSDTPHINCPLPDGRIVADRNGVRPERASWVFGAFAPIRSGLPGCSTLPERENRL